MTVTASQIVLYWEGVTCSACSHCLWQWDATCCSCCCCFQHACMSATAAQNVVDREEVNCSICSHCLCQRITSCCCCCRGAAASCAAKEPTYLLESGQRWLLLLLPAPNSS